MNENQNRFCHFPTRLRVISFFIVCAVCFFLVRLPLWRYPAQTYADTWGYVEPALSMLHGDFSFGNWQSERGLTYPLLLMPIYLIAGEDNHQAVAFVQVVFGFVILGLLLVLGWKMTGFPSIGFLLGMCYALNVSSALLEMTVLSETFTLLILIITVFVSLGMIHEASGRCRLTILGTGMIVIGFLCAFLSLSKHMFVGYWLVPLVFVSTYLIFLSVKNPTLPLRLGIQRQVFVLLIPLITTVVIFYFSWVNWRNYGWFTFNPLSGINLSNAAGGFIEYAEEDDCQDFVKIYLDYRQREIQHTGTHSMTIYRVLQDRVGMEDATSRVAFERLAFQCSLDAIINRPDLYFNSVRKSARMFWDPAIYSRNPLQGLPKLLEESTKNALKVLRILFHISSIFWLVIPILLFISPKLETGKRAGEWWVSGFLLATVWYVYLVASLAEFGENRRYKAVVEPLIPCAVIMIQLSFFRAAHIKKCWIRIIDHFRGASR